LELFSAHTEISDDQFLQNVEKCLEEALVVDDAVLPSSTDMLLSAARHLCVGQNAKRARPLLTLYFGRALGAPTQMLVKAATAAELIHSASLMHDDVIDNATMRRGRESVNAQFGNTIAVLGGNYLLSVAFSLLRDYPQEATSEAVLVIANMTKAAIAEIEIRERIEASLDLWREIALGKTGVLFAWCGQAAAFAVHDMESAQAFRRCGHHIGVLFQLADDLRDLVEVNALKDRFADLRNKEPSYPILVAASKSASLREEIVHLWLAEQVDEKRVECIGDAIISSGALETTLHAMTVEIALAKESLGR